MSFFFSFLILDYKNMVLVLFRVIRTHLKNMTFNIITGLVIFVRLTQFEWYEIIFLNIILVFF